MQNPVDIGRLQFFGGGVSTPNLLLFVPALFHQRACPLATASSPFASVNSKFQRSSPRGDQKSHGNWKTQEIRNDGNTWKTLNKNLSVNIDWKIRLLRNPMCYQHFPINIWQVRGMPHVLDNPKYYIVGYTCSTPHCHHVWAILYIYTYIINTYIQQIDR